MPTIPAFCTHSLPTFSKEDLIFVHHQGNEFRRFCLVMDVSWDFMNAWWIQRSSKFVRKVVDPRPLKA
jgi:hypothetical protein